MGVFSRIFKPRDKPSESTSFSGYRYYLGGTSSGNLVTGRSAMQISAVYSCVRVLSETIASLPLHVYQYSDEGSNNKALKNQLFRLLHDEPNPETDHMALGRGILFL